MADTEADEASTPKVQEQGVQKMEETTLGGKGSTGQDVSVILVASGGNKDHKLACIRLHSRVLSTHSKYFHTCLSERWNRTTSSSSCESSQMEFVLEAQAGVESYIGCFSGMYSPLKSFEGVEQALEILKVASQIDFQELMERISLYLSCKHWMEEDEVRVLEYSASPDFPRSHLKDLVARLGMDKSKEELCDRIRVCIRAVFTACCEKGYSFPEFIKGIGRDPSSEFLRMVIGVVNDEAKTMFVNVANEWNGKDIAHEKNALSTQYRLKGMGWILEELLNEGVAEELVRGIVHLDAIPKYAYEVHQYRQFQPVYNQVLDLSQVVLRIYKEVATSALVLSPSQRIALLANWYDHRRGSNFGEAAAQIFLTLPVEGQAELVKLQGDRVHAHMGKVSLIRMISKFSKSTIDSLDDQKPKTDN